VKQVHRPRPPRIPFLPQRVQELELRIDDGDDAPLQFVEANARAWISEFFLVATRGSYDLLIGDPDASPPRDELERMRDVVLAVAAAEAQADPLEPNPAFSLAARLRGEDGPATPPADEARLSAPIRSDRGATPTLAAPSEWCGGAA
jgi:hypothetical protein